MFRPAFGIFIWIALSALWGFASSARAEQPTPSEKTPLAALIESALAHNELLQAAELHVAEKTGTGKQAAAFANPEISLSGGQKKAKPDDPSEPSHSGLLYEAEISQQFFFPGKQKLRGDIGRLEAKRAQSEHDELRLSLAFDITRLAYEYEMTRRKAAMADNRHRRFSVIQSYLSGHTFASPQQKSERLIVQQRHKNLAAQRSQLQSSLRKTFEKITLLTTLNKDDLLIDLPWLQGGKMLDVATLRQRAAENHFPLLRQKLAVEAAEKENRLAKWENTPDFTLFASYGEEKAGDTERFIKGGISFPLPLLNQNGGARRATYSKMHAEKAEYTFKEREIETIIRQLLDDYERSRETVQSYAEADIVNLDKDMDEAEREFRKGRISLMAFIELDSEIGESQERALEAQMLLLNQVLSLALLTADAGIISHLKDY